MLVVKGSSLAITASLVDTSWVAAPWVVAS